MSAVFVKRSLPNYAQPWQTQQQRSAVGSAFVIDTENRYILTNCHVVAHHITIHVRRPGHPKKWKASQLCEGKACDLALMTVGSFRTEALHPTHNLLTASPQSSRKHNPSASVCKSIRCLRSIKFLRFYRTKQLSACDCHVACSPEYIGHESKDEIFPDIGTIYSDLLQFCAY
jgi:hypothetical protein